MERLDVDANDVANIGTVVVVCRPAMMMMIGWLSLSSNVLVVVVVF